jgi:hypothetical protein
MEPILKNTKVMKFLGYTAAATSDPATTEIDCLGYTSAFVFLSIGTVTDTADLTVTVKGSNTVSGASAGTALSGASIVRTGMTNTAHSNTALAIDIATLGYRYIYVFVDRGTANTVIESGHVFLYNGKAAPAALSAIKSDAVMA